MLALLKPLALVVAVAVTLVAFVQMEGRAKQALPASAGSVATPVAEALSDQPVTIRFDQGASPCCLTTGWGKPEAGSGVWSDGHAARLRLVPIKTTKPVSLSLTMEAFVAPGLPAQSVILRSGDKTLATWRLTSGAAATVSANLPPDLPGRAEGLPLELQLPDADSPAHRTPGAADPRLLAVKLKSLDLTPAS